jgi:hypothetical protein
MPNIVTNKLRIDNAKNFKDKISLTSENSLYVFLSKPSPWSGDGTVPDPKDYSLDLTKTWDEMVSLKRILPADIAHVVKRINWEKYQTYAEYNNLDTELFTKSFYIVNSEFNVYKCIHNNNDQQSLIEPTGISLDIVTLSDGYRWKYMYSIGIGDRLKFLTNKWMPVLTNDLVVSNAKPGAIEHIKIVNTGFNYDSNSSIVIEGDGLNATANPKIDLGVLYDFTYVSVGSGYRYATANLVDNTGSGRYANIQPIVSPYDGHGYDPVLELNASLLMINSKTTYTEGFGDFPGSFSYRIIGIVKNPKNAYNQVANTTTLNALSGITVSSASNNFSQYEFVQGSLSYANAYVVVSNISAGNGYVKFIQNFNLTSNYSSFIPGETIIGKTSGAIATVSNLLYPEIMKNEGDILYVENKSPIIRTTEQTDNLHLVIEF